MYNYTVPMWLEIRSGISAIRGLIFGGQHVQMDHIRSGGQPCILRNDRVLRSWEYTSYIP